MINPVESGLDLFSAIVRDRSRQIIGMEFTKMFFQEVGKNCNHMRTQKHNFTRPLRTISCHLDLVNKRLINYLYDQK